jgi:uncharacterized membrane protein
MYELWLAVHIVCAVVWAGGAVAIQVLGRMYAASGDVAAMLDFNRRAVKLATWLFAPLAVVLIVAGVLLVEEVGYAYTAPWIVLGFLGLVFSLAVGVGYSSWEARRIDAAAGVRRVLAVNALQVLVLLLVVVDMAVKPG